MLLQRWLCTVLGGLLWRCQPEGCPRPKRLLGLLRLALWLLRWRPALVFQLVPAEA